MDLYFNIHMSQILGTQQAPGWKMLATNLLHTAMFFFAEHLRSVQMFRFHLCRQFDLGSIDQKAQRWRQVRHVPWRCSFPFFGCVDGPRKWGTPEEKLGKSTELHEGWWPPSPLKLEKSALSGVAQHFDVNISTANCTHGCGFFGSNCDRKVCFCKTIVPSSKSKHAWRHGFSSPPVWQKKDASAQSFVSCRQSGW